MAMGQEGGKSSDGKDRGLHGDGETRSQDWADRLNKNFSRERGRLDAL